jgi:hypothetical protein
MPQDPNFFYDGQIRRFITQFIRLVSNFHVQFGKDRNGNISLQRVPVIYGDQSRQAAQILRGNTENSLSNVPAMAVYVSAFDYDRERVQEPFHVSKIQLRQQRYDPDTGNYDTEKSDSFTVERLMPVPYKLTLKVDIWTSNTEQKLQIIEQIATLFNPALEIQSTDNYIDWTSLSAVFLTGTNWDSRSIPAGGEEPISVATMTFELPIWISAPAKVQRLGVVYKILGSIYDTDGNLSNNLFDDETYLGRRVISPYGYRVLFVDDKITLLKRSEISINDMAPEATANWKDLIDHYGELRDGLSEIRLKHHSNDYEVVGHVSYNPLVDSQLIFNIDADTVPTNSLDPVDAIIDPFTVNVDQFDLLSPDIGTRYLILNPIGNSANAEAAIVWGDPEFIANANDIIEYGNSGWSVAFDSQQETSTEYVTNLNTGTQYKWFEGSWSKSVEGLYQEGEWSVVL